MQMRATTNALGWDMSFATNHLGFALTEALVPNLPNGANVVFVVSAVEDPGRKPAKAAASAAVVYFCGRERAGRVEAGGSAKPGFAPTHVEAVQSRYCHGVRP